MYNDSMKMNDLRRERGEGAVRIMAVDYGDERTGIAVSDPTGLIAGETFVIREWDAERLADRIAEEAQARGAGLLVLGHPLNMDGTRGPRAEKSEALRDLLSERTELEIVLWDERRTTVDAARILHENGRKAKKQKAVIDAVAASLILEGYLGSLR